MIWSHVTSDLPRRTQKKRAMPAPIPKVECAELQVQRGCLVLDPFVGTGSMLVAAAAVGAITLGADIDMRVIRIGKVPLAVLSNNVVFLSGSHRGHFFAACPQSSCCFQEKLLCSDGFAAHHIVP